MMLTSKNSDTALELGQRKDLGLDFNAENNIIQSKNDTRQYRAITLANGIRALLIADIKPGEPAPKEDQSVFSIDGGSIMEVSSKLYCSSSSDIETDMFSDDEDINMDEHSDSENLSPKSSHSEIEGEKLSAASLTVGVGSFSDPPDIPGLAHFLEHMVFMGSEKYPDENEFDLFIKKNGGNSNAFTEAERTVFFFDIQRSCLRAGLHRFAQFFIKPLMKKESVDREIKAVDNEFAMNLLDDKHRKEQLLGSLAKPDHPMSKFTWGNSQTLKETPEQEGIDIYERLRHFQVDSYSSQFMTLAVQSRHTLDTLQKWVMEIFEKVPNNGRHKPDFSAIQEPFATPHFCRFYRVVPVKNIHQIQITWPLPHLQDYYRVKPLHYIGWLVGHEGKGSILSYLKQKMWATDLMGGNGETGFDYNSTCSLFIVLVSLTELGMQHVSEVVAVVFEYLEMLRRAGPQQIYFNEIKTIEENEFRWQEQGDPMDYVQAVSENMQQFPPCHYLTGDHLADHYDQHIIQKCQDLLTPRRCNMMLLSPRFKDDCKLQEPWHRTMFAVEDIPEEWLSPWDPPSAGLSTDINGFDTSQVFHLPAQNTYIATDFILKEPDIALSKFPVAITNTELSRLWFKQDKHFNVPKGYIGFSLVSASVNKSPLSMCMFDLFVKILEQNLSEVAYAADVAQLCYSLKGCESGMLIRMSGFNHKLPELFKAIVDPIAHFDVTQEMFDSIKDVILKSYHNHYIKPDKLEREIRLSLLQQHYWTTIEKARFLSTVTKPMLLGYIQEFTSTLYVEGLVQGNFTAQEAREIEQYLLSSLKYSALPTDLFPERRVVELPVGERHCQVQNMNSEDNNSIVTNYYMHGPASIKDCVLNELLSMRMEGPCFDILRTREQLGYSVYCSHKNNFGILGLSITVCNQASKFTMKDIDDHIERFLEEFADTIHDMKQDEFSTLVTSLKAMKTCEDNCLGEETKRNWEEIENHTFMFNRLQKEVEELDKVTFEEFYHWFLRLLTAGGESYKKVNVTVLGNAIQTEDVAAIGQQTFVNFPAEKESKETLQETLQRQPSLLTFLPTDNYGITDIRAFKNTCKLYPEWIV